MRTFHESLNDRNQYYHLQQSLMELYRYGVDPKVFIEKFLDGEEYKPQLYKIDEQDIDKNAIRAVQSALKILLDRIALSRNLQSLKLTDLQNNINVMLQKIRDQEYIEESIIKNLIVLSEYGINPKDVVQFYIENCVLSEAGIFKRLGDAVGGFWSNLKGTARKFLTGQGNQRWGDYANNRTQNYDMQAIANAMQALKPFLRTNNKDFENFTYDLILNLSKTNQNYKNYFQPNQQPIAASQDQDDQNQDQNQNQDQDQDHNNLFVYNQSKSK